MKKSAPTLKPGAFEQDQQVWANDMKQLLESINRAVQDAGGALDASEADRYRQQYRDLLEKANRDCPPPDPPPGAPKRGRVKRSKARNLLECHSYDQSTTEISGCFRSQDGADAFCRIRGYLTTCRQHGMSASQAI